MATVGVGITTRNRPEVLDFTLRQFAKYDNGLKYVIVDDNSDEIRSPDFGAYYYNKERLGVAKSKNRCIKLLNTDHVFLFDDDCFPTCENWWEPWLDRYHHMTYSWPNMGKKEEFFDITFWSGTLGCCLYLSRHALKTVGGFDPDFGIYGYEHYELTNRIFRSGIVPHRYISPKDPCIWSFDAQGDYEDFKWINRGCMDQKEKAIESKKAEANVLKISQKKSIYREI